MTNVFIQVAACSDRSQVGGIGQRGNFITEVGTSDYSTSGSRQGYAQSGSDTHESNTHGSNRTPRSTGYYGYNCGNQERSYQHPLGVNHLHAIINHQRNSACCHPSTNKSTNAYENQNCRHTFCNFNANFIHNIVPGYTNAESNKSCNACNQKEQRFSSETFYAFTVGQNNQHCKKRGERF